MPAVALLALLPLAFVLELLLELLAELVATGVPVEFALLLVLPAELVAAGVPVELELLLDDELPVLVLVALAPWPWLLELCPVVGILTLNPAGKTTRCPGTRGKLEFALKKSRKFVPLRL